LDLLNSISKLVGSDIQTNDSMDMPNVFLGKSEDGRKSLVMEANTRTALRSGEYVMIPPYKCPVVNNDVNIELGNGTDFQLFNVKNNPGQTNYLAHREPELLQKLIEEFEPSEELNMESISNLS
jgi:hypothetical protein